MSTAAKEPKYRYHQLTSALAMCAPAVRLVVVEVWASKEADGSWQEDDHQFHAVIALVAKHQLGYMKPASSGRGFGPTHEAMEQEGWRFNVDGTETVYLPLIYDEEYGLGEADLIMGASNVAYRMVPAPWDPAEDATRLAPVVEQLRQQIREKESRAGS